jgi:hypothetical protein
MTDLEKFADHVLAEARNAVQWHKGGMRTARAPRLSRDAALAILDTAWRLGLADNPYQELTG